MLTYLMDMQPKPEVPSGSQLIDYYEEQISSREALIQSLSTEIRALESANKITSAENAMLVEKIKMYENIYARGEE